MAVTASREPAITPACRLLQDWSANTGDIKSQLVLAAFRTVHWLRPNPLCFVVFLPLFVLYRVLVEWFLGIELPWHTRAGPGLQLHHGQALVVNRNTVLGAGCILRSCTTIGSKRMPDGTESGSPIIGNRVDIGANAVVIGPIRIGDDVTIGAGAVVVKSVPAGHLAIGNPARILQKADIDSDGGGSKTKARPVSATGVSPSDAAKHGT